jgi:ATP-dependent protease ClpP protease subunit
MESLAGVIANQISQEATEIHLFLSSVGGDPPAALAAYNVLRSFPVRLITHNVGRVGSAANTIFLAGETRYASPRSDFQVHRVLYDFREDAKADINKVKEILHMMVSDHKTITELIADRTRLSPDEIERMLGEGALVDPDAALAAGIIHEIREPTVPDGAKFVQMAFQRTVGR